MDWVEEEWLKGWLECFVVKEKEEEEVKVKGKRKGKGKEKVVVVEELESIFFVMMEDEEWFRWGEELRLFLRSLKRKGRGIKRLVDFVKWGLG